MLTEDKIDRIASALKEVTDIVRESIADDVPEPPIGTVVTFVRVWKDRSYHYAAVRAEPGWYLTGNNAGNHARTWGELHKFAGDAAIRAMVYSHTIRPKQESNDTWARLLDVMPADFRDWWNAR